MSPYRRMLNYAWPHWKALTIAIIASFLFVLFNGASVWLTASFIDVLFPGQQQEIVVTAQETTVQAEKPSLNQKMKNFTKNIVNKGSPYETLKTLCGAILILFLMKNVFFYCKGLAFGHIEMSLITDIRNELYTHLHSLSLSFFHKKKAGEISSIMLNDVEMMRKSFAVSFNKLLVEPINIITFMVILFIISWRLSLIAVLILPLSTYTISRIGKSIRRKSLRNSRQIAGIMSIIHETLYGIRVVKAFAMEKFETMRFFRETQKFYKLVFRAIRLKSFSTPISETTGVLIGIVLLWFGGQQVLVGGSLDAEDFVRFIVMLFAILTPVKQLNNVNIELQQGIASALRVFSILDVEPKITEKENAIQLDAFHDRIEFRDVNFRYETSSEDVLTDINLAVNRGDIIAIVGHSGAGKSTLVDLLPRFYDPWQGEITIDGLNLKDLSLASLRSLMGIVTQETILFNDTIMNNIAYGMEDADFEAVKEAAIAANAYEFIATFPEQFETAIGDKGTRLSGGQRQRIAIARALLKNPPILIFDEATSSLDTESEQKVQMAIERLMKHRTVFVIAHRLSTIKNANKIIVLDNGRIVETGSHKELIADEKSLYSYLYHLQFGSENQS